MLQNGQKDHRQHAEFHCDSLQNIAYNTGQQIFGDQLLLR